MSRLASLTAFLALLLMLPASALAQDTGTISGTVTDSQTGEPLPGVNVAIANTTRGAATTADGEYTIENVPAGQVTVQATFVGFSRFRRSVTVTAGETTTVDIALEPSAVQLEGVAVTALGFETQRDQLGAAQSKVEGADIVRSGEISVSKSLSAKATGLNITSAGGDPGAAARIVIRGNKSISGDNQPLIIVDGIPISNETTTSDANQVASVQQQSRLSDINPADIASVEVLKGASAAALWGSRAQNGVIVIETKTGSYTSDINVSFRSSVGTTVLNQTQELQRTYGQGSGGVYAYNSANSWGDRIANRPGGSDVQVTERGQFFVEEDGELVDLYAGVGIGQQTGTEYYAIPSAGALDADGNPLSAEHGGKRANETFDQGRAIFEPGFLIENNLSVSGGGEEGRYYLSLGNVRNKGIIPENSTFQRTSIRINADRQFTDRFNVSAGANFVRNNSDRVQQGSNISGLLLGQYRTAPDFNNETDYTVNYFPNGVGGVVIEGRQRAYRDQIGERASPIYDNPLFTYNNITNSTVVNRLTGNVDASFDVTEWFNLTARGGVDTYTDRRYVYFPQFSSEQPGGQSDERQIGEFRFNGDLIGRANRRLTDEIGLNATLGFSLTHREFDDLRSEQVVFSNPLVRFRALNNAEADGVSGETDQVVRRTGGVFSELDFDMYDQLFVTLTGRVDQASSFGPDADNTFFYPSASVAWQFSDVLPDLPLLSFGKLRSSVGVVGREPDPYLAFTYFSTHEAVDSYGPQLNAAGYGGGSEENNLLGNPIIVPEETTEYEVGTDLRFVNDRVTLSGSYYYNVSRDVIFDVSVAPSTGFDAQSANAAEITNQGVELELGIQWPSLGDFQWDTDVRWWTNDNEVTDLAGVETVLLQGFTGTSSNLVEGQSFGVLFGDRFREAPQGCTTSTPAQNCEPITAAEAESGFVVNDNNRVLDANGFPTLATNPGIVGDPQEDWRMGIGNTLRFRGLSLYTLFDFKIGGDVWNGTKGALYNFGRHADQDWSTTISGDQANLVNFTGRTPAELVADGAWPGYYDNGDGSYTFRGYVEDFGAGPVIVDQPAFTGGPFGGFTGPSETFVEDGSFVKLREVTLAYDWRGDLLQRSGLSSVEFSVSGANLLTFTDYTGVDPETNLTGPTNGQGLDYFNNPNSRQYRFTIQLNY